MFTRLRVLALLLLVAPVLSGCQTEIAGWVDARYHHLTGWFAPRVEQEPPSIIPEPQSMVLSDGHFSVADGTPVLCSTGDGDCAWIAGYLTKLVKQTRGLSLVPQDGDTSAPPHRGIVLRRLDDPKATGDEGYRLDVTRDGIVVSAGTRAGLFYGCVTLWELLTQTEGRALSVDVADMQITDEPRFTWRGLMLDSVRHFQSPAFVKSFIDAMALHKLNVLQWHLTDDQGWRIEIKKYPRLTSVGAWRVPAGAGAAADIDQATGKPRLYGGFYTQDEIREIVAYAQRRNITIVPEIEMPGHALAAIVAYPQLGSVKNPPKQVSSDWGVFPYLYNVDDSTFDFLENVLTEVMALFPSHYIHVGGDEAVKDQWKASPKIQAQMHALDIKNEDALQGYFTARIGKFLAAHGRRLIGWDEILEGGVPPDATITSWRGIDGAITAAKTGHDAVLSPAPTLYFDNRQAEGPDEPPGRGAIVSLKDVYDFNPVPASLTPEQQAHIIGLQGNIWTEHIRQQDLVDYAAFPRAAALAELAWSPAGTHNWQSFLARLPAQLGRYRALGITHSESALAVRVSAQYERAAHSATVSLSNQADFGVIHYTVDGAQPTANSPLYKAPLTLPLPSKITTAAFVGGTALTTPTAKDITVLSLLSRDSHDLTLCTKNIPLSLEDDAPVNGPRAVFLVDIMNPCWIYPHVDLTGLASIEAGVGQVPFNFQVGDDIHKIALLPPQTPDGELEVHLDTCTGPRIAVLPLAPAVGNDAITTLRATLTPQQGVHDLCFVFTRRSIDPIWAIDWVQLVPERE
ncbi:MAG: family 20 glycosylhydrolase [Alphaproteobacteria bacterium]|nr:family 20 glycosylhydrolase [Alphaproteobacteria bacterium]